MDRSAPVQRHPAPEDVLADMQRAKLTLDAENGARSDETNTLLCVLKQQFT